MEERPLVGGIANVGKVVRVGQHVLRPPTGHTASIHAFLRALDRAGFVGAPLPVGIDDDGRERVAFIEGDVPLTPYPTWSLRLVADAYGLDRDGRAELLTTMDVAFARIEAAIRRSIDAGNRNAKALWDRTEGGERFDRRRRWWAEHHEQFVVALR
jgi:hypothetical protein